MVEILRAGILDYTPLEYARYNERLAAEILASALREAARDDVLLSPVYVRGLRDEIPDDKFDMFLISGSPLSTTEYSKKLDRALGQIREIISDVPTFGICFGLHAIANITGNGSRMIDEFEIGRKEVMLYSDMEEVGRGGDRLLFPVNHFYKITNSNREMKVLAVSNGGIQIADATEFFDGNPVMGVQFHPEFAATEKGWYAFRKIYEKTLDIAVGRKDPDATIGPIVDALPKPAKDRLLQIVREPEHLAGKELDREEKDLMMSPFHNIDYRRKLLGKKESERTYAELRNNSQAVIRHFVRRVLKEKEAKKKEKIPTGKQLKLAIS